MGISTELHLVGNEFSNVGTSFFIAYLIAEVPNSELHFISFLSKKENNPTLKSIPPTKATCGKMARN